MKTNIMIAGAVAIAAALCSTGIRAEWETGIDSLGYMNMHQHDKESGTSIAFGYDGSVDCTDIRVLFVNYFPKAFMYSINENAPELVVDGNNIVLPVTLPNRKVYDDFVAFTYMYTPTQKLISAFLSEEGEFTWTDSAMASPATYSNSNFVETLNAVVNHCINVELPDAPEEGVEIL
jgi:hypothetical protein